MEKTLDPEPYKDVHGNRCAGDDPKVHDTKLTHDPRDAIIERYPSLRRLLAERKPLALVGRTLLNFVGVSPLPTGAPVTDADAEMVAFIVLGIESEHGSGFDLRVLGVKSLLLHWSQDLSQPVMVYVRYGQCFIEGVPAVNVGAAIRTIRHMLAESRLAAVELNAVMSEATEAINARLMAAVPEHGLRVVIDGASTVFGAKAAESFRAFAAEFALTRGEGQEG